MPKKVLFILAPERFQDYEFSHPYQILKEAGFEIRIASQGTKTARGVFGKEVKIDLEIKDTKAADYDGLVLVGGPGAVFYQKNTVLHQLLKEFQKENKVIAAICISPTTLAYAGILKGKKATVWNNDHQQYKILKENGAIFIDRPVVVDGKIITANGPPAAVEFGKKILEKLKEV